jgi:HTH-type transcriptional regulator/antitoxin MqsA
MSNPFCPETGAPMHRGVRPMTLTYKGESITFDMPGWYCDSSAESLHTGEDMKVSDRMLNRLKARIEGLLEPEKIRHIRKKLHLTQEVAGRVIGGGPRAFQKYESGDLLPSRAITSALLMLDYKPEALTVLRSRQLKIPNLGATVKVAAKRRGTARTAKARGRPSTKRRSG